jgi:L-seryl-tRNA(Ser) seleniumtransferase
VGDVERRANRAASTLRRALPEGVEISVEPGESQVGSGAVPVQTLPTRVLAVRAARIPTDELARRLRHADPPVFARIADDRVLLDFRTIQPKEDKPVAAILIDLLKA